MKNSQQPSFVIALQSLFNFLVSTLNRDDCDHTLKNTKRWLVAQRLDVDAVVRWLQERGGFCDCEVLFNVQPNVCSCCGGSVEPYAT